METPNCTLTTACFELTNYNNYSRNLMETINNMKSLLEVPCYLVIYTDKYCIDKLKEIRNSFHLEQLTHYIVTTIEDLYFHKHLKTIKSNREIYFPSRDVRTCAESHLVCCSKFQFVLETIELNPFNTTKFGWIDSNIQKNFSKICENYNDTSLINILHNSCDNKFHIQILNVQDKKYKNEEYKKEYYNQYRYVCCGCLFITNKDVGIKILKRLNDIFEKTTMLGYGHGEEMFYLEVLDEFYDDVDKSYGDYGQILNNYFYPTKNLNYIHEFIITKYLNFGYNRECYDCCKKVLYSIENLQVTCDPHTYMSILFQYFVSCYYVNRDESVEIINHILEVLNKNVEIKDEFDKKRDFYISQFKYSVPDIKID
jgi:hypothetical protein